jgi:hypothetical protein
VALASPAELLLSDTGEVGEPEDIGLHARAKSHLEVGADGEVLVFGEILAARAFFVVRKGQWRLRTWIRTAKPQGTTSPKSQPGQAPLGRCAGRGILCAWRIGRLIYIGAHARGFASGAEVTG